MESLNDMDTDKDEHNLTILLHKTQDLEDEFLKEMSEEALSMLKNEYEHLTSKECIIEMFEANGYEFTEEEDNLKLNKMNKEELVKLSAQRFIDNIYDQMRKENYPEDFQIAVINQIKNILK